MSGNADYYNIELHKQAGQWPFDYLSAYGMIPYLKRMSGEIVGAEVGVLKGENIYVLLETLPNIKQIFGIDHYLPHTDYNVTRTVEDMIEYERVAGENLSEFGKRYKLLKKKSTTVEMMKESLDFVLIDADHSYDAVKADLNHYYPFIKKEGIIFVHDTQNEGVFNAIMDFRNENKLRQPLNKSKNYVDFWVK